MPYTDQRQKHEYFVSYAPLILLYSCIKKLAVKQLNLKSHKNEKKTGCFAKGFLQVSSYFCTSGNTTEQVCQSGVP